MKKLHLLLAVLAMFLLLPLFSGATKLCAQDKETKYDRIMKAFQPEAIRKLRATAEAKHIAKEKQQIDSIQFKVYKSPSQKDSIKKDTIWCADGKMIVVDYNDVIEARNNLFYIDISAIDTTFTDPFNHKPVFKVINGHLFVNLGLPSGLYWASDNIGATELNQIGDYFAWGETEVKSSYTLKNSLWGNKVHHGNLTEKEDVATQKWGKGVRMPTVSEYNELKRYCEMEWHDAECFVVGPNHFCIDFPAGGHKHDSEVFDNGQWGSYWTANPNVKMPGNAHGFVFNKDQLKYLSSFDVCERGYLVRPVAE